MKAAKFKFIPFSIKQKKILTWWCDGSPHKDKDAIICDGAVRSGKTVIMSLSFVIWAMDTFNNQFFGMAGKTIGSFRRNVLFTLKLILALRGYIVEDKRSENMIVVRRKIGKGKNATIVENSFFIFGGKDERSQDLVQGFTAAGFFFDEVALQPQSFINQAIARCSVEGAKLWFNCNPDGPFHWFKLEWIDCLKEKNAYRLQFSLDDNPSLSEKKKEFYRKMFKGVFFLRYVMGLWVMAEGIIYDMFGEENQYDDGGEEGPNYDLYYTRYYTIDYGTTNPFACIEIIQQGKMNYADNLYYYNSREKNIQKTDDEYVTDIIEFIGNKRYTAIIVDPSAASFKVAARKRGLKMKDADNEVLDGIRLVASLFSLKRLKVNREKCKPLIREAGSYVWDSDAAEKGKEQPIKENDHVMDALRYYCKTIIKLIGV